MELTNEIYLRQVNGVEDLLGTHPEFIDVLTDDEKSIFCKYFLPDWDTTSDYKSYRQEIISQNPSIETEAQNVLHKFLKTHSIPFDYMMPPQA